ncbi:serine/arginine repetitive matrix protein 2-like isoform X3 [Bolinopsis microptera]|uniref:serine/arginine repetitive matrix protein 2-like isoform X3 n=1 Tax=Bolinopsis microptera TaxID=2820187 RepID=UPI00307A253E
MSHVPSSNGHEHNRSGPPSRSGSVDKIKKKHLPATQRSNSCVEAIPYIGSDRDRDRSKTPERTEKRDKSRTPDRTRNKTPERAEKRDRNGKTPENQRREQAKTPETRDREKTPERRDRAKTPERKNRAKTPERRDRAKTPDKSRRSKSRTPEKVRSRSPDSYSERNSRTGRRRSPPDLPTIPIDSIAAVPYPTLPDRMQVSDSDAPISSLIEVPLTDRVQIAEPHPVDEVQTSTIERRETELFLFDKETIKRPDQEPESSDTKHREGRVKTPVEETYQNSSSSSGKRRHRHQDPGGIEGDGRYRNGRISRGEHRPRAYSDSDAENYQESAHNSHPFRLPPPFKHRSNDRRQEQFTPVVYKSDGTDMYYKIPCRIPYSNRPLDSHEDSDYDNLPRRSANKSSRHNGALLIPGRDPRSRDNGKQDFNRKEFVRDSDHNSTKDPAQEFRPYPARFAPLEPPELSCPYLSETTENEYLTPAEQAAAHKKGAKHRRSHSDSSSSRTIMSPWSKNNTILTPKVITPKYPLLSTRDQTLTSQDRTLESASRRLSKVKCPVSNNNSNHGNSNMWHDPLLGVDKKHIAYPGDAESQQSRDKNHAESFAEFTTDVSMNYLSFIWNSPELIRKLLWAILFLGFFIYSLLCCWRSFGLYFSMPTSTKYNMYFEPNRLLRFPSITICNMNPHNNIYLARDENKAMQEYLANDKRVPWPTKPLNVTSKEYENFNVKRYYRQSGQELNDFIEDVVFFEEEVDTPKAFKEQFTTHGRCWTFNVDGSRKVNRTGMDFGLSFGLNINQSIYPNFVTTAGIKVMFHNYYEPARIDEYGMALTPGTENFISLSYERVRSLKEPYGNCRDDALRTFKNYSISGCERECFTEVMVRECQCRSYYLKAVPGRADVECNLHQEKNCVAKLIKRYHAGEFAGLPVCKCPDPCISESYLATMSTAEYPAKNHGEALEKYNNEKPGSGDEPRDVTFYRENFLKVHIYFEILSIKEVEKVGSYKWSNLMGDVGGQLGLFLGANIVTIFEFVDFYLRLLCYRKRRVETPKQNSSYHCNTADQEISPLLV